jgi:hypothetical protein
MAAAVRASVNAAWCRGWDWQPVAVDDVLPFGTCPSPCLRLARVAVPAVAAVLGVEGRRVASVSVLYCTTSQGLQSASPLLGTLRV